jgi:hypothetical protein
MATITQAQSGDSDSIATAGEVLPDGTMLELVRNPSDHTQAALLHWDTQRATISREVRLAGSHYVPIKIDSGHLRYLPSGVEKSGSVDELFHDVHAFIAKSLGLREEETFLLTAFSLATFFSDCVSTCPCILLYGPSPAEAIAVLRALASVNYHPALLADSGSALPERLRPTRLICQPDGKLDKLLAPFQFSDFGISQKGNLRQIGGATAIYVGDFAELKSPFVDSCLSMPVTPARVLFSAQPTKAEAESLRNRLLSYRLHHHPTVKTSTFDAPRFCGAIRDVARAYGACIVGSPDLQERLVALLQDRDEADRLEIANSLPGVVIEVLRALCHERKPTVHVGEVAEMANLVLSRQGEVAKVSARRIGTILKHLGFRTIKLDAGGRGILLDGECRRIHDLANDHALPSLREQFPGCPYCQGDGMEANAHVH